VPFGAGGSADLLARILATHMQAKFGQAVVVENRAGAGGSIGTNVVAKAAPDGYTLLLGTVSSIAVNAALYAKLPFDVDKDLQPVTQLVSFPNLLIVNPKLPVNTVPELIAHLKARHAEVLFNSNAITLSAKAARALIDAGLDELRVSLDASTPATYQRIRGVDAFDRVLENLEQLAHLKRELGLARPLVSLWFTALKDNIEEIPGLARLAVRAGATGIHLQRLVYNGLGLATEEQSLYGRLHEREAALIQAAEAAARATGVHFSASGATAPAVSLTPARAGQPWSACRRPWTLAYVTVNGNALPCCIAPWITGHYDGIILGNLYRESLEEVWWGERYLGFRRALQTADPPEPCRGCGVKWSL